MGAREPRDVRRRLADQLVDVRDHQLRQRDMVGHTGVIEAAVRAIEPSTAASGGRHGRPRERWSVPDRRDHGNADHVLADEADPNTARSLNPVPVIVTVPGRGCGADPGRRRATVLEMLGVDRPRGDRRAVADLLRGAWRMGLTDARPPPFPDPPRTNLPPPATKKVTVIHSDLILSRSQT